MSMFSHLHNVALPIRRISAEIELRLHTVQAISLVLILVLLITSGGAG